MLKLATINDLYDICRFTDYWLAGRGLRVKAPGAVNDYFISPSQHKRYILKYKTYIVRLDGEIIAWAVIHTTDTMIHLLIAAPYRGRGIGSSILKHLAPGQVRSKSNQSTGNPAEFYIKNGYTFSKQVLARRRIDIDKLKPNRKPIIDIFVKGESDVRQTQTVAQS